MGKQRLIRFLKIQGRLLMISVSAFSGFALYSRVRYRRSPAATALEHIVKRKLSYVTDTPESAAEYLKARSLVEDREYVIPKKKYKSRVYDTRIENCQTVIFDGSDEPEHFILYIHGGGFAGEMMSSHVSFCDTLAKRAKARVIAPIYPLAPNHTYNETYEIVKKIYRNLTQKNPHIILAGDSAGGGFAAAFCNYLSRQDIPVPAKLLLISPWVDISMSGIGYKDYEDVDPLMNVEGLKVLGKAWAGDTDTKDPMLSPLFGDVDCLPETLVFTGTREVFHPDIIRFCDKFKDKRKVSLIIGKNMDHVYPLYPIPEAIKAMKQIVSFVRS